MTPVAGPDKQTGGEGNHGEARVAARKREEESEAHLLAQARAGDLDAFVELIGLHDRPLRALAYRLLGDQQMMDDVLQDAYLKAFQALPRFEGRSAFGSWLHRIAYNACMDQIRRRSSGWHLPLGEAGGLRDPAPDPGDVAAQRLDLAAALACLSPIMRATILLVDAEGMDYQTAAEVLGIPVGTVRSRLSQARRLLRRALSQDEWGRARS